MSQDNNLNTIIKAVILAGERRAFTMLESEKINTALKGLGIELIEKNNNKNESEPKNEN